MADPTTRYDSTRRLAEQIPQQPGDPLIGLLTVNIVGTVLTLIPVTPFILLVFAVTAWQALWLLVALGIVTVSVLVQDFLMIKHQSAPIRRALAEGGKEAWQDALVCALNYPINSVKRTYTWHIVVPVVLYAVVSITFNLALDLNVPLWMLIVAVGVSLSVLPLIHAAYEYFQSPKVLKPVREYAEAMLGGSPEPGSGLKHVSLGWKLLVPFVSLTLAPLIIVSVAAGVLAKRAADASGAGQAAAAEAMWSVVPWVIGCGLVWAIISIFIARGFSREVRNRADALLRALARVREGDLNHPPRVSGADEFGDLAVGIREMMGGLREREQLQDLFGRHTSPEVVEILMSQKKLLDGARKDVTILFSDIRNFTQMSERMEPEEVVALLNRYLDVMVGAIHDHHGRIDKFIGDGILAVFGFPVEDPDHVVNAVKATLAMRAGLAELNFALQREGKAELAMGAGLHTGAVVAGSIGSKDRLEYTVIGDTVNTASRIEGLTKKLDADIVVSGKVQALTSADYEYEHRGSEEVKGKTMALDVFVLKGARDGAGAPAGDDSADA